MRVLTNVTIYRSPKNHVLVPYNRVDEFCQASYATPEHIQTGASIPSCAVCPQDARSNDGITPHTFEVPIKWNGTHQEADK